MANAAIKLAMTGDDKTAAMFASVQKRAQGAMGNLKKTLAFAGVGLGLAGVARSAYRATQELGLLSDQSQRMGVSTEYIQKLTGAFQKVGVVGVTVDGLATAFSRMAKDGYVGADGFRRMMEEIAAIPDEQTRVIRLTAAMGRDMGGRFAALVRKGPEAFREGLDGVMAMMPAVSAEAASAGDSAADALAIAGAEIKTAWLQTIGDMVAGWKGTFGTSFEESVYIAVEYFKWGIKAMWQIVPAFVENMGKAAQAFVRDWRGGIEWLGRGFTAVIFGIANTAREVISQFWRWLKHGTAVAWGEIRQATIDGFESLGESAFGKGIEWRVVDTDALAAARDAAIAIKRAGIEAQAKLASGGALADADVEAAGKKAAAKVKQAAQESNKLIFAGTYDAVKLAMGARGGAGMARGGAAWAGGSAGGSGAGGSAGGGDSQVARLLRELIGVTRDGWRKVDKIGVV